jgi:hypothetical protein
MVIDCIARLGRDQVKVATADTDGDGLPDFQEVHKYRADANKKNTARNGVSNADWQQRRVFTYNIRAVVRVMRPYNVKAMSNDYQDIRVLAETNDYGEFEVIVYPFNSNAEAIQGNPNWKKDYAGMDEYLAAGVAAKWDETPLTPCRKIVVWLLVRPFNVSPAAISRIVCSSSVKTITSK